MNKHSDIGKMFKKKLWKERAGRQSINVSEKRNEIAWKFCLNVENTALGEIFDHIVLDRSEFQLFGTIIQRYKDYDLSPNTPQKI